RQSNELPTSGRPTISKKKTAVLGEKLRQVDQGRPRADHRGRTCSSARFLFGRVIAQSTATKKSTTKCPPRDFRLHLRRDTARTSSLLQIGLARASRIGAKWRQNRRR